MDYRDYRKKYKNNNRNTAAAPSGKPVLIAIIVLSAMLVAGLVISIVIAAGTLPSYISSKITVEAGSTVEAGWFLKADGHVADFAPGSTCNTSKVGTHKMKLIVDGQTYNVKVRIVDTVAPAATAVPVAIARGSKPDAAQFVANVLDETQVTAKFKTKPVTSSAGVFPVIIILTDKGGNETEIESELTVIEASNVKNAALTVELGSQLPEASEFTGGKPAKYITDISAISSTVPGYYVLYISVSGVTSQVILNITDTVAPVATVTPQVVRIDDGAPDPRKFVSNIVDASEVKVSYEVAPVMDPSQTKVDVVIVLTDYSGNRTKYPTYFTVLNDKTPPVITLVKNNLDINSGDVAILWSNAVYATDESGECELYLDSSRVNKNLPGVYNAYFVARDPCGNESRQAITVTVHDNAVSEDLLNSLLDQIIASIITPGMSNEQKALEVFKYIQSSVSYTNDGSHDDWRREAYYGLNIRHSGDCFTYMAAAYALFTRMGIDSLIVERAPEYQVLAGGTHFWCMINIGTTANPAWYHFDATPQRSPYRMNSYLLTDAQINAHTKWRNATMTKKEYYYGYEASQYPASATVTKIKLNIPSKYYD